MDVLELNVILIKIFGHAPFFVSPARHSEAQDMSGDLKQKKQNKKHIQISFHMNSNNQNFKVINIMNLTTTFVVLVLPSVT
jgi:hypothetical protein